MFWTVWNFHAKTKDFNLPITALSLSIKFQSIKPDGKTYALCGALFSVKDSEGERFIAACKNMKPKISALNWTIFNDYIVTAVKEHEALYTHTSWKLPHLLFFCELDSMNKSATAVPIPKSVFDIPSSGTI